MSVGTGVGLHPEVAQQLTRHELEDAYAAYRKRQVRGLLRMLPREAIRPLYRAASERLGERERSEPLELLLDHCESLLPLPPFEVWRADLHAHLDEHLRDWDDAADAPTSDAPATVAVRRVEHYGTTWIARLRSFRREGAWRGHIAFEDPSSGVQHTTAPIFFESRAADLRERFLSFDQPTLGAFLRSALP